MRPPCNLQNCSCPAMFRFPRSFSRACKGRQGLAGCGSGQWRANSGPGLPPGREPRREAHAGEALAAVAGISHMEPAAHAAPPRVAAYCLVSGGLYSALKSSSSRSAATSVLRLIQAMSHPSSHARTAATSSAVSW